ncbi:MAG: BlaI/MecI/CopY family transcriptional regulator [Lachnospiraceae bacterium]|nr:BlaI/MecI/CopY family transcriptional regulator [Lachnospiraceae bacterium]MBR4060009.1 BlaI/MecI/CopY family transcriptional regulator [Lachnospiraceae bacterium]
MEDMRLGLVESHFADIVWKHEPIHSRQLTVICEQELNWKRTTTYTVLKKLCNRGIFQNQDGIVSSLLSKDEFHAIQSEKFVEETFAGSFPAFFNAFSSRKKLTAEEIAQVRQMIDSFETSEE